MNPNTNDLQNVFAATLHRHLGDRVMEAFADPEVNEIYVNAHEPTLWCDRRSQGRTPTAGALSANQVLSFLNTVAKLLGSVLDREHPQLQAEMPLSAPFRGARLQGFVPPLSAAPAFVIRKLPTIVYSLADYVEQEILTAAHRLALIQSIEARANILVAGGTRSGKTTFANALLREITTFCPEDRVVILEDTRELQCVGADHLALRTGAGLSLTDLVKFTLRASPDRIVIGEVRDGAALDLLDAWATGHPGGIATVHATTAAGALDRLDRLAQRNNVPSQRDLIAQAVDLIVVIVGGSRARRVTDIVQVEGLGAQDRYQLNVVS